LAQEIPLSEITRDQHVLELVGSAAGRYAGKLFHDSGARVVQLRPERSSQSPALDYLDAGKQSEDLASEPARKSAQLEKWLSWADVVIESSAPGPLARQVPISGFPRLIRLEISPFGPSGPYAHYKSNAFTDEAFGGHLYLNGEPHREPLGRRGFHSHYQAGLHGFIGALAALRARERTKEGQKVEVSHFEGMTSLHQHTLSMWTHGRHVLKREGNHQPGLWHPAGVYPCRDGHIMLVLSSSAHRDRFLVEAGIPEILADPRFANDLMLGQNKDAFDEALGPWLMDHTSDEIIAIATQSGAPAGRVASPLDVLENPHLATRRYWQSWQGTRIPGRAFAIHEQCEAEFTAQSDAAQSPRTPMAEPAAQASPLDGIRVLDLSRLWAGPLAGRIMADLGADVIQIEAPDARGGRKTPPGLGPLTHLFPNDEVGERPWNRVGSINKLGRNKRSLALDLKQEEARDLFKALVAEADVVLENFSPRVMPELGLAFEHLLTINPALIYTAISGYGNTGPDKNRVALGPVIEAESGAASLLGYSDSGPYRSGVAWADPMAGLHAVAATLMALNDRASDPRPRGRYVEVSMLESALAVLGDPLFEAQKEKADPKRNGNQDPAHVPQDVYPCSGKDRWLAISIENDEAWRALCDCARLTHWSALSRSERIEKRESIDAALAEWTKSENSLALEAKLQAAGVIAAAVRNAVDLVDDPQLSYGPFWTRLPHPETGTHTQPGCPIRLEKTPASYRRPAACLGEHNEEILIELLGADESLIEGLKEKRILIEEPP